MRKWKAEEIEALAKAYFQHIDGELEMEGGWNELTPSTQKYFIERMAWAVERAKV